MAEVKWIKIVTDIFDDEKILLIESLPEADSIIVIWFKLLCLAGKQNNSGVFSLNGVIPYTEDMFATIFRRKAATVSLALRTFESFGMVELINGTVTIPNWGKHQNLDQMEAKKEYMKNYMTGYRQKQLCKVNSKTNSKANSKANVNQADIEVDIDLELDKKYVCKDKPHTQIFIPPTLEEVKAYCQEQANGVDAERWFNFYKSKGWKVGINNMENWQASIQKWEKDNKTTPSKKPPQMSNHEQRQHSGDYFESLYKEV